MNGALSGSGGFRMSATGVLKEKIDRLRKEADGLWELLVYLESGATLSAEADEALWALLIKR